MQCNTQRRFLSHPLHSLQLQFGHKKKVYVFNFPFQSSFLLDVKYFQMFVKTQKRKMEITEVRVRKMKLYEVLIMNEKLFELRWCLFVK